MEPGPKSIGLTGGIGCGKSAVAARLEQLGLRRLDTDKVAREVVAPGAPALVELENAFGSDILRSDGSLDREALGAIVFSNPASRKRLEQILHPRIWERVRQFHSCCEEQSNDCVVEVPLLFENDRQDEFDEVWVVSTSPELQKARLVERNGWSPEEIDARVASQMPLEEKVRRADVVILNTGTLDDLHRLVDEAWKS